MSLSVPFLTTLVKPWCAGKDLASLLLDERKLSSDRVKFYMSQLVLALETLHDLNIVHRDVKTANIFLTGDGNLILGDFGLAKQFCTNLTCTTNERCGIPSWMSPAQIAGSAYSFDTDMWGLGMVMFRMLTGRLPSDDSGVAEADVTFRAGDCVDSIAQDLHPYFRDV
ncbi:kinase-like domain-containing protein [Favolaschia claudopus]|uniref:Kinase-like domain-containing protein n=1 Tax=Favolaschia claudopus TaxID=2862362 RepID=A0AAW0BSA2_9AGAR